MKKLWRKAQRFTSPLPLVFIIGVTILIILYGRGYRPNFKERSLKATGLLSAISDPIGAQVYINGTLKTATNNPIDVDPGWYKVKITKEGFIPWEKNIRVQGEVVSRTDAFLFPTSPSLSPLTTTGILNPLLSPDGTKIAYIIPTQLDGVSAKKSGLWIYELSERPLGLNRDPRQIGTTDVFFDFTNARITWSPDTSQIMADNGRSVRLYNLNRTNDYQDVSANSTFILKDWDDERFTKNQQILAIFKQEFVDVATSSAKIIAVSPDETKVLYEATSSANLPLIINPPLIGTNPTQERRTIEPGKLYVYDSREDKNFFVLDIGELPQPNSSSSPKPANKKTTSQVQPQNKAEIININSQFSNVHWFPTSRHLVLTLPGKIDIMEYDRTNWITVYSGPFVDGFIAPWPNGSRIIIMTNLNPGQSELSNLYTVNLR